MQENERIGAKRVVTLHYTLKDGAGKELDSSAGGEPRSWWSSRRPASGKRA